jgi:Conserved TM helix
MQIPDSSAAVAAPFQPDTQVVVPFDNAPVAQGTFVERMRTSFGQFAEVVPALIGALVILLAGYLLARLIERGVDRMLRRMRLNQALERGGVMQAVERSGSHFNPTRVISNLVFWLVMFAVLLLAANALGLQSLADVFQELVSYIPSVIAAVVIITVGIVLGGFVGGLIMASAGGMHGGPTLARVGKGGVIVLAIFMALQELGIATDIVTTAFAILFGAVALAMALSFGLGNRELAGEVTREWYERWKAERDAIARETAAAEAAEAAEEAEFDREAEEREARRRAEREARKTPPTGSDTQR